MNSLKDLKTFLKTAMEKHKFREDTYIFSDQINNNQILMDKLFNLGFEIKDYYYNQFEECFEKILEDIEYEEKYQNFSNIQELKDNIDYCFDELRDDIIYNIEADIYTANLTAWLASDIKNVYYLTEVLESMDIKDGSQLLSYAQIEQKREIYEIAFEFLRFVIEEDLI
jgi:hypothetical protein